jgi:hypothetical protein
VPYQYSALPTEIETKVLRRIAGGSLIVTLRDGRQSFAYENGTPTTPRFTPKMFKRFVEHRWIEPDYDSGPVLPFGDDIAAPAQVYRARRVRS